MFWLWVHLYSGLPACTPAPVSKVADDPGSSAPTASANSRAHAATTIWEPETRSPREDKAAPALEVLQNRCGRADAALARVARQLLGEPDFGADLNDVDRVGFAMRAAGVPYLWPRAWSSSARADAGGPTKLSERFDAWLRTFDDGGERRCGLAAASNARSLRVTAVAVDVLADVVQPLPTQARTGQWMDLRVQLLEPATDAKVILEGPRGEPAFVPCGLEGVWVHSRFPLASPGQWLIQVMASVSTGPRPVAEANVFVDEAPPQHLAMTPVPGESADGHGSDPADSLLLMLNQARLEEGRKPLTRSAELDRIALQHARSMHDAGHVGHDVGDGSPKERLETAGIFTSLAGENVVRAADTQRAHRLLWASPSHRSNILHRGFRNVGIGTFVGPDRTVWACELFAALD